MVIGVWVLKRILIILDRLGSWKFQIGNILKESKIFLSETLKM